MNKEMATLITRYNALRDLYIEVIEGEWSITLTKEKVEKDIDEKIKYSD